MNPLPSKNYSKITAIVVLIIPLFICLALLAANLGRVSTLGMPHAAIVNNDEPVTLQTGQTLPAGRQVIAALTDPERQTNFEWSIVTGDTAKNGLNDGTYDAVVTIPKIFSEDVAGILEGSGTQPGELALQTNGNTALISELSDEIIQVAVSDLNTSFTVTYLTESLEATGMIRDGMIKAADGAAKLTDGLAQASDGAKDLTHGASQLANGNHQLAQGSQTLANGVRQLAQGTSPLASGATQLSRGLDQYVAGVKQAADGSVPLASGIQKYAGGIEGYVAGVQQLYNGITQPQAGESASLQSGAHELADALTQVTTALHKVTNRISSIDPNALGSAATTTHNLSSRFTQLQSLIDACAQGDTEACSQASRGVGTTATALTEVAQALDTVQKNLNNTASDFNGLQQLLQSAEQLAQGAQGLASGIDVISDQINTQLLGENARSLTTGAHDLASGVSQLSQGLQLLTTNSPQLTAGAQQLADGAVLLSSGAQSAADGASSLTLGAQSASQGALQLSHGAQQLADGQGQLFSGSQTLVDELRRAGEQIPTYTRAEAQDAASALGTPVVLNSKEPRVSAESSLAPSIIAIAIWLGVLSAVIFFGAMRTDRVNASKGPLRLTMQSILPVLGMGAVQALFVLIALALSGVKVSHPVTLVALVILTLAAIVSLHFALTAMFGMKAGVILSLLLFALQMVVSGSLLNLGASSFLEGVQGALPIPQADEAFREAITGIGSSAGNVWVLVFWLIASLVVTVASVSRRRNFSADYLRELAELHKKFNIAE